MNRWDSIKLGELVDLTGGAPFKSSDFGGCGIPVLKIKNVKANRLLLDDVDHISEDVAKEYPESFLQKGDLLITMTGNRIGGGMDSWVGKVARFNEDRRYCLNQRVGIIRPKSPHAVDIRFLSFCLSTGDSQRELIQIATGSGGQANLSPKQILAVKVPHPPLSEQRAIAAVLGSLDDKIELNRRMNETLEALAQSLFKSWFVDATQSALPNGWREATIRELASNIQYGLTQSASTEPVGPRFLRITDIQGGRVDWGNVPYCKVSPEEHERYRIKPGDVLVARTGASTGENIYLPVAPDAVFASYLVRFQFAEPSLARLVGVFMRTPAYFEFVAGCIGGSAQPNASAQVLAGATLAVPLPALAKRFADTVAPFDQRIAANNEESRTLAALRDALLPKLLSGELRVPAKSTDAS